tara:strand:+ start:604 stop:1131 length:528 start_codon:yes stop_codon:yes gene_type:complete
MSLDVINLSSSFYYKIYLNPIRGACMKKITIILVISFFSLLTFAQDKHFERNQLPQLNQEILDSSDFKYEKILISTESIIPVQTQRVRAFKLRANQKEQLLSGSYSPLVIDKENYLIDGHHRLDGIKELKIQKVKVLKMNASIEEIIEAFSKYRDYTPTYEPDKQETLYLIPDSN